MPKPFLDQEIDAVVLAYQQVHIENPGLKSEACNRRVQLLLAPRHPRIAKLSPSGMGNMMGRIGLMDWYQKKSLSEVPEWADTGWGQAEWKAMHEAFVHSAVREEIDGAYRPGDTDEVTRAMVAAVEALGREPTLDQMFRLRCMFGWGTCVEIYRAGFMPGRRRGGVLPKRTVMREMFVRSDSVGSRLARHDTDLESLRADVGRHDSELSLLRSAVDQLRQDVHDLQGAVNASHGKLSAI